MNKIILATIALGLVAGCQTTTPASRANESKYAPVVKIENRGNNNEYKLTLGDGLYASADGGGDTQRVTPTQTTDTKPEIAVAGPGGSAGTGNAKPGGNVLDNALNKVSGWLGGGTKTPLTKLEADALKDCIDGNCSD